jgi:hypothetical protein
MWIKRSIRMLHRLAHVGNGLFFSAFDPSSVCDIVVGSECRVERELRQLVNVDARYKHVRIRGKQDSSTLAAS